MADSLPRSFSALVRIAAVSGRLSGGHVSDEVKVMEHRVLVAADTDVGMLVGEGSVVVLEKARVRIRSLPMAEEG